MKLNDVNPNLRFKNDKAAFANFGEEVMFFHIKHLSGKYQQFTREFGYSIRRKVGEKEYTVHYGTLVRDNETEEVVEKSSKMKRTLQTNMSDINMESLDDIRSYLHNIFRGAPGLVITPFQIKVGA